MKQERTRRKFGSRICKPNFVCEPKLAGRSFLWARHYCRAQATYPKVWRTEPARIQPKLKLPPYLVLLRVGFALPAPLLWRRCALTAPFHPYLAHSQNSVSVGHETLRMGEAVSFLWHFPSTRLEPGLPDVIRHTALRSSDFPPILRRATVRSGCQHVNYSGRKTSYSGHHRKCGPGFGDSHGITSCSYLAKM